MYTSEKLLLLDEITSSIEQVKSERVVAPDGPLKSAINQSGAIFRVVSKDLLDGAGQIISDVKAQIANKISDRAAPVQTVLQDVKTGIKDRLTGEQNVINETIFEAIVRVLGSLVSSVGGLAGAIGNIKDDIIDGIANLIEDIAGGIPDLIQALKDKMQGFIDGLNTLGNKLKDGLTQTVTSVGNWIRDQITRVVAAAGGWIGAQIQEAREWVTDTIENAGLWVTTTYENAKSWLGDVYQAAKENVLAAIAGFQEFAGIVGASIQDKIDELMAWFQNVSDQFSAWFRGVLGGIGQWINREVLPRLADITAGAQALFGLFSDVWSMIDSGDYEGAFALIDRFAQGLGIPAPVATIQDILSAVEYFKLTIQLQFIPAQIAAAKTANINLALDPTALQDVASALFRGKASEEDFYANARLAGITTDRAKFSLEAAKAIPPPGAIQEGFLRGEINEEDHDRLLHSYGYSDADLQLFKALYWLIPPPNDLIRMSVREVFSPEIAERYGQFDDFPEAFVEWAAKIGLNEQWAKNYWAAHWELPSPQMGFEMLHRGVIDKDELTLLLRSLDVMPYWRERLIKISYNPLTRVDVRRMYQLGVLTAEQVFAAYLELGYDREKANWLTEFTKRYSAPEDESELTQFKSLARATYSQAYVSKIISEGEYREFLLNLRLYPDDVELLIQLDNFKLLQKDKLFDLAEYRKDFLKLSLQAYDRGLLNVHEVTPLLSDLGYSDGEIALEISLSDYNRELTIRNLLVSRVHDQYVDYIVDIIGVHDVLNMFNFAPEEIARLQEIWDIERNFRVKRPPLADLKRFMTQGLLSLDDFLNELRGQGYHEKYINLFAQSLELLGG